MRAKIEDERKKEEQKRCERERKEKQKEREEEDIKMRAEIVDERNEYWRILEEIRIQEERNREQNRNEYLRASWDYPDDGENEMDNWNSFEAETTTAAIPQEISEVSYN